MLLLVLAEVGNTEAQKWTQHMLESGVRSVFMTSRERQRERKRERERER